MKICDLTQFYSPVSGGVKRYLHEKIAYIDRHAHRNEHVLIVPGAKTKLKANGRSRVYTIRSPLVSRTAQYRALLNLRAVEEILDRERPDVIESADPYQLGWRAIEGRSRSTHTGGRILPLAFYRSVRAKERNASWENGDTSRDEACPRIRSQTLQSARRHSCRIRWVRPRAASEWGVRNVRVLSLGVNTEIFRPDGPGAEAIRRSLGLVQVKSCFFTSAGWRKRKTRRLCFALLRLCNERRPNEFHLLVIGDGPDRTQLRNNCNCELTMFHGFDTAPILASSLVLSCGRSFRSSRCSGNIWPCSVGMPGVRDAGSGNSRQLHGQRDLSSIRNRGRWKTAPMRWRTRSRTGATGNCQLWAGPLHALRGELYSWPRVFDELFCIYRELRSKYRRS